MQNNFLTSIRSMKLIEGCKGTQVYAVNPSSTVATAPEKQASLRPTFSLRSKSISRHPHASNNQHHHTPSLDSFLSTFGLPSSDLIDPSIDHFLHPIEHVDALASSFRSLSSATYLSTSSPLPSSSLCNIHLEHCSLLQGIGDPKLLRRALRSARIHSQDIHHKVVLSAWLRFERREDELEPFPSPVSCSPTSPALECPRAALSSGYVPNAPFDLCPCRCTADPFASSSARARPPDLDKDDIDLLFCIGNEEIPCVRSCMPSPDPFPRYFTEALARPVASASTSPITAFPPVLCAPSKPLVAAVVSMTTRRTPSSKSLPLPTASAVKASRPLAIQSLPPSSSMWTTPSYLSTMRWKKRLTC